MNIFSSLSFRRTAVWLILLIVLGYININIVGKERTIRDGDTVLLQLAPVDPRSLMQGDYMILDYAIGRDVYDRIQPDYNSEPQHPEKGTIVVRLDENNVAQFVRFHTPNDPIGTDERLLKYGQGDQWRSVSFGADNYFFQEGTADLFETAVYGELRVTQDGTAILIGLMDENFERIVAP